MEYTSQDLILGKYKNIDVWVCQLRYRDYNKSKPLRNQLPTKARLTYDGKYSNSMYRDIIITLYDKKGNLTKQIPYQDNSSFDIKHLSIFDDEKECIDRYIEQCEEAKGKLQEALDHVIAIKKQQIETLDKTIQKWN